MATTVLKVTCQGQIYRLLLDPEPEFSDVTRAVRELCLDGKEGSMSFSGADGAHRCLTEHCFEEFLSTARACPTGRPVLRLELQPPQASDPMSTSAAEEDRRDSDGLQATSGDEPVPKDVPGSKKPTKKRRGQKRGKGTSRRAADGERGGAEKQVGDGSSGEDLVHEDAAAEGRGHGTAEVEGLDEGFAKEIFAASDGERSWADMSEESHGVDMDLGATLKQQAGTGARQAGTGQHAAFSRPLPGLDFAGIRARSGDAQQMQDADVQDGVAEGERQPAALWPDTPESSPRGPYQQPCFQPVFWMPVPILVPAM